jgi:hypothetical protein
MAQQTPPVVDPQAPAVAAQQAPPTDAGCQLPDSEMTFSALTSSMTDVNHQ